MCRASASRAITDSRTSTSGTPSTSAADMNSPWVVARHSCPAQAGGRTRSWAGGPSTGFSRSKDLKTSEKTHLEFRAEFFNLTNHPNFSLPGFAGNGFTAAPGSLNFSSGNFGKITFTRDNPNDPRQIQFALKLYW